MPKKSYVLATLRRRVNAVPKSPGVYRWLDRAGRVLYVGKAKSLRNRMQQYVRAEAKHSAWTEIMVRQIADFDVTVTNSELEALMLETNLIKELRPKYNILMKDDKNYVYLRISVQEQFPRVEIVRRVEDDGALYFGPKTSAEQLRESLSFLRTLFPFRNCKMGIEVANSEQRTAVSADRSSLTAGSIPLDVVCKDRDRPTPCVDYHIKQCIAPCIGSVMPEQYRTQAIDGVVAFFQGKYQVAERILMERMAEAAKQKKFERAARLRDQLKQLRMTQEKQLISDTSGANTDTIGAALLSGHAYVVLLRERDGKLVGEESFSLQGTAESLADVLGQFLPQYYSASADLPEMIVLGEEPADRTAIEAWLSGLHDKRVRLVVPERGKKSKLLKLAEKNADWKAHQTEAKWESETRRTEEALKELQTLLRLPAPARRIEGYDISHLGCTHTVGSMVVFHNGKPKRDHYRSFNMRTVKEGQVDDYRSLAETLRRRLRHVAVNRKKEEQEWKKEGVAVHKGRKADLALLEAYLEAHTMEIDTSDPVVKDFVIAECKGKIVGCVRLKRSKDKTTELASLFVEEKFRGKNLGRFLARKILRSVKKGKVYLITKVQMEEYYADLGFRVIQAAPKALDEKILRCSKFVGKTNLLLMMYDTAEQKPDDSFSSVPDLLLIDGGKGQLATAEQVLKELKLTIPVAGLAKREEEIFVPGNPDPLVVTQDSPARFLLQRLRDEAHRFANSKREGRQKASTFQSKLDEIPGIGEVTKEALLKKFGTVDAVIAASDEELGKILTQAQVVAFKKYLAD